MNRPVILVVDPDPEKLAADYRNLTAQGFRVATYSSLSPACLFASAEAPAAILSAFVFPECDGRTALRRLKTASPESPLLVRMDSGDRPHFGDAIKAGADILLGTSAPEAVLRGLEDAIGIRSVPPGP